MSLVLLYIISQNLFIISRLFKYKSITSKSYGGKVPIKLWVAYHTYSFISLVWVFWLDWYLQTSCWRVFLATQPEICTCKVANGPQQNRFQLHVEEWSVAGGRFGVLLLSGELEHSPEIAFQGTMYSCKLQQVPSFLSNCSLITLNLVARLCFLWQGYIPLIAMPCHYVKLCGATPILDWLYVIDGVKSRLN